MVEFLFYILYNCIIILSRGGTMSERYMTLGDTSGPEMKAILKLFVELEKLTHERGQFWARYSFYHQSLPPNMKRIQGLLVAWTADDIHFRQYMSPLFAANWLLKDAQNNPYWSQANDSSLVLSFPSEWVGAVQPLTNIPGSDPQARRKPESPLELPEYFAKVICATCANLNQALRKNGVSFDAEIGFQTLTASIRRLFE